MVLSSQVIYATMGRQRLEPMDQLYRRGNFTEGVRVTWADHIACRLEKRK